MIEVHLTASIIKLFCYSSSERDGFIESRTSSDCWWDSGGKEETSGGSGASKTTSETPRESRVWIATLGDESSPNTQTRLEKDRRKIEYRRLMEEGMSWRQEVSFAWNTINRIHGMIGYIRRRLPRYKIVQLLQADKWALPRSPKCTNFHFGSIWSELLVGKCRQRKLQAGP